MLAAIVAVACGLFTAVTVVDDSGAPIAGARVAFHGGSDQNDFEMTAASGSAVNSSCFLVYSIDVSAEGYRTEYAADAHGLRGVVRVTLESVRALARVAVATGAPHDLHELPVATAYLDREAIAALPPAQTDALLRMLPAVDYTRSNSAFTNYGQLRESFDGAGTDRGLVLVDGVPAQDGFGGQIDWAAYPPDDLARIELLEGAGSALYGSSAVGGVLALSTLAPPEAGDASSGSAEIGSGSRGTDSASFHYGMPVGDDAAVGAFLSDWRSSYLDLAPGYTSPIDSPAQSSSSVEHVRASVGDASRGLDLGALFSADQQQEGRPNYFQDRRFGQQDATYHFSDGDWFVALTGYTRDAFVTNAEDKFPTAPGVARYLQDIPTVESGLAAAAIFDTEQNELQFRIDDRQVRGGVQQFFPSGSLQNASSGAQSIQGAAAQETYRYRRLEALFGARLDDVTSGDENTEKAGTGGKPSTYTMLAGRYDAAVSPRAALRYDLSPALALRASAGTGFRAPYLNELIRSYQIGTVVYAANPDLVPERSATDSIGFDDLLGAGRLAFDLSTTRVHDAIQFITISATEQMRENVTQTQTDGATMSYSAPLASCVAATASGTTQYARVTDGPPATLGK
ncbi:MAG TPA: TonB-dependent receptor, partial [Candidatus Eremiobacteraceae bacterium]|nr:TonB-dependent receptor [Candidatus Eremiobacteraceae bacterium]